MAKPTNAKRRPAPPARPAAKKEGRAPDPAPDGRPAWVVPAAAVGVVVALLLVAVIATRLGGDDGGGGTRLAQTHPVTVTGQPLPALPQSGSDPAVGMVAPVVAGASFDGTPVEVGPGRPTIVLFLAHWCPHCQREVPLLAPELERITPPGVEVLTVSTGTREGGANYPPSRWLEEEAWPTPVLADDGQSTAAGAYGLTGYPFFVVLDGDGKVVSRGSGGKSVAEVEALLRQVAPAGSG